MTAEDSLSLFGLRFGGLPVTRLVASSASLGERELAETRIVADPALSAHAAGGPWERWDDLQDIRFLGLGRYPFQIRAGSEIRHAPEIPEGILRAFLLGRCTGIVLIQRGLLTLHGSSVLHDGKAIAFVGASSWGKSTTAAALCTRGYRFGSDDMVAIASGSTSGSALRSPAQNATATAKPDPSDEAAPAHRGPSGSTQRATHSQPSGASLSESGLRNSGICYPGLALVKLDATTAAQLGLSECPSDAAELPDLRFYQLPDDQDRGPTPLGALFVLVAKTATTTCYTERLSYGDAWVELTRHSYAPYLLERSQHAQARHFEQCADLAATLPCYRLHVPRSFAALDTLAATLEPILSACDR